MKEKKEKENKNIEKAADESNISANDTAKENSPQEGAPQENSPQEGAPQDNAAAGAGGEKKKRKVRKKRRRSGGYAYNYNYSYSSNYSYGYSQNGLSDNGKFAIVESYKAARTNIMFSLSGDDDKIFAVTSYSKGEGKSTVSSNLAISFSKMEKRVLVIDCDLRRPNVHNIFKVENKMGLSNIIGKMGSFEDVVHRNVLPNLDILPSGTIPPNPSELLCSPRFVSMIKRLKEEYDYIIFDTPPIGVVADALLLKDLVAGFVVVLRERRTTHGDIQNLIDSAKMADSKILGFIKVGCIKGKKRGKRGYYYYYNYYYY